MPISIKKQFICLLAATFMALPNSAFAEVTKEDRVKAAIIFKLTKFVSWPKKKQSLTLCVIGSGSINNEIQKINRKFSMGRRLSVTHKMPNASMDRLCDLVYIHNSDNQDISLVLNKLKDSPVLTISDSKQFAEKGGTIELYRTGSRIKFAINKNSIQQAQLSVDSQLLKLAKIVE